MFKKLYFYFIELMKLIHDFENLRNNTTDVCWFIHNFTIDFYELFFTIFLFTLTWVHFDEAKCCMLSFRSKMRKVGKHWCTCNTRRLEFKSFSLFNLFIYLFDNFILLRMVIGVILKWKNVDEHITSQPTNS